MKQMREQYQEILFPFAQNRAAGLSESFKWGNRECEATSYLLAKLSEKHFMFKTHQEDLISKCGWAIQGVPRSLLS